MALGKTTSGYLAILGAAVLFGVWPSVSKLVVNEIHPLSASFYAQLVPALLLWPTLRRIRVSRSDLRLVLFTGVMGAVLGPVVYFYGLQRTTASNSVLLSNSESLFTMLFAYAFLAERTNRYGYAALGGIALGAFLVTTQLRFGDVRYFEFLVGNTLLVVAAVCWAMSNTGNTLLLRRIAILPLLSMHLLIGTAFLFPLLLASGTSLEVPPHVIPLILFLSLTTVGVFSILFFYAFRTIGAMRTGAVLPTSALWGLLLALVLFPEQALTEWQVIGGAVMIGSLVALYTVGERWRRPGEGETLKPAASDGPNPP